MSRPLDSTADLGWAAQFVADEVYRHCSTAAGGAVTFLVSGMGTKLWRVSLSAEGKLSLVDSLCVGQATPWVALCRGGRSGFLIQRRDSDRAAVARGFTIPDSGAQMELAPSLAVSCGGIDAVHGIVVETPNQPSWLLTANADGVGVVAVDTQSSPPKAIATTMRIASSKNSQVVAARSPSTASVTLFVTNLGGDALTRTQLDVTTGTLSVVGADPLPAGTGPRRMLITKSAAYVIGETAATVTTIKVPSGGEVSPDGRMLYASNRSDRGEDSIVAFAVDDEGVLGGSQVPDNRVTWTTPTSAAADLVNAGFVEATPGAALRTPRDMCVMVNGGEKRTWYVVVANQMADTITAFVQPESESAALHPLQAVSHLHLPASAPTCLAPLWA